MPHNFYKFIFDGQEYYEDLHDMVNRYGAGIVSTLFMEKGISDYSNELPPKDWMIQQRDAFKKSRDYLNSKVDRYDDAILSIVAAE